MGKDQPTRGDLLKKAITACLASVHTSLPGVVVSFDEATSTATIRLAVKLARRVKGERVFDDRDPLITRVPVMFPAGGGASLRFSLDEGDLVTVLFFERSVEEWLATGEAPAEPVSERRHSLADAVAVPLGGTLAAPPSADSYADGAVVLKGDDIRLGSANASSPLALVAEVDDVFDRLKLAAIAAQAAAAGGSGAAATWSTFVSTLGSLSATGTTKIKGE